MTAQAHAVVSQGEPTHRARRPGVVVSGEENQGCVRQLPKAKTVRLLKKRYRTHICSLKPFAQRLISSRCVRDARQRLRGRGRRQPSSPHGSLCARPLASGRHHRRSGCRCGADVAGRRAGRLAIFFFHRAFNFLFQKGKYLAIACVSPSTRHNCSDARGGLMVCTRTVVALKTLQSFVFMSRAAAKEE